MLLRLYQVLLYLIQPLIWLRLLLRSRKAPAYRKRWAERYGFCAGKVVPGGIMLHSVSVGETLAVEPNVEQLPKSLAGHVTLTPIAEALQQADVIVMLVDHQQFKAIRPEEIKQSWVVDTKGVWR
ncbi:UDP binding domain-containing protein [Bradyrhizobium sp.]|uniref:UDP binding domain-containing protein n=1 Tax=Bradyrhizobium sp. TaxID=376 RepID=UPI002908848E|nr:UDP binding domain-containing protein [Bradyrhizobium sp.]MDU6139351.1 UDP binding domain-containing protein [Bradyrhizobium sp.]